MTMVTANNGILSDTNLYVEDTGGSGRPVVFIHGWPLSGESWTKQVPALRDAGYRVITYDRRGFGRSDKKARGYDYDTLSEDLEGLMSALQLQDVTLVGFSMGGGEVARYVSEFGEIRLHSVVFASAVPPYLLESQDNPEGPLSKGQAAQMAKDLTKDEEAFYDQFTKQFFSAAGQLMVSEQDRQAALELCRQADKTAALKAMASFGSTDFRDDLAAITVPTLVIHGDSDATVPFEGSGARTHVAVPHSELVLIPGAPHGCNVSHADQFNHALLTFLAQ